MLRSRVPRAANGTSLLDYLTARFPYLDRARWLEEVAAERLRIDGRLARAGDVLRSGNHVAWTKVQGEPYADANIVVLHADDDVLVVDKPAHLAMHTDGPFIQRTLVHLLRQRTGDRELALVHRLDRETSGVCVTARTAAARTDLTAQFAEGTVHKVYFAIVRGRVASDRSEFKVEAPIGAARTSRIALRREVADGDPTARPAITRFVVVERGPAATLLRCEPLTGRTHQIRVHAEHLGHPVLGDKLYGRPDADYLAFVQRVKRSGDARDVAPGEPDRQLLHAGELTFTHPRTGAAMTFIAPLPAAFATWLHHDPAAGPSPSRPAEGSMP